MKPRLSPALSTPLFAAMAASCLALPTGKAAADENDRGHGRMPTDSRDVIHSLFSRNEQVDRTVERTRDGYVAKTTSTNPEVAEMLQTHVIQMQERLDADMGVRRWDPAFAEMRTHYEEMVVEIENIEGGVVVSVKGNTPEAIKVAQNHAGIVSGFVREGKDRMHAKHAPALAEKPTSGKNKTHACEGAEENACTSGADDDCKKRKCSADRRESPKSAD